MKRQPRVAEKVAAAEQIGLVVDVAAIGRASAGADDAGAPEFAQVVRDQVLGLAGELHEFADSAVAATELHDDLPAQRIAQKPEDFWRRRFFHERTVHQAGLIYQVNSIYLSTT